MRALIVFLLVAVAFGLVVFLYPESSSVEGAAPAGPMGEAERGDEPFAAPPSQAARGFLERASSTEDSASESRGGPRPADKEAGADSLPDWLSGVAAVPEPVDEGELRVTEALVHGSVQEVEDRLRGAGLGENRARLARSFAMALAGERRRAITLAGQLAEADLSDLERALLQEALGARESAGGVSLAAWKDGGLSRGMGMALAERRAESRASQREYAEAARYLSDLLISELDAPWEAHRDALERWSRLLGDMQSHHRWNPKAGWPGLEITVEAGDSAISIRKRFLARRPGTVMCAGLILRANAIRGYLQPGQVLRIPTERVSVLVDLSARWVLYMIGEEVVEAWPVGIGRPGQETRTGLFTAGNKLENPPWMKVGQAPVPFGDPENPLGTRWIGWFEEGRSTSYGFHGTWEPDSVGNASSDGCIRFRNEDVEELFEIVPEGASILVRP